MANRSALTTEEKEAVRRHVERLLADEGSQAAVAKRVGVTQQMISKAKNGEAGPSFVRQLAEALGTTFDQLLERPTSRRKSTKASRRKPPPKQSDSGQSYDLPDLERVGFRELLDRVHRLARNQLKAVLAEAPDALKQSVELADAALELTVRVQRSRFDDGEPPAQKSAQSA